MQGAGQDSSSVAPLGLLFLVVMGFLTLRLSRRNALIPLLITTCYMPLGQEFVVFGLHMQFLRILLLLGWARVFMRGEHRSFQFTTLDKLFIWWALATLVVGTMTKPSMERFVNRAGEVYNAVGSYFLVRCWMTDLDDIIGMARFMALLIVPLAVSMVVEKFTSRNIFAVFGGVPEITAERDGKLRCQGAFRHPILAGTYAATLFPLVFSLWFLPGRGNKRLAVIGSCCAAVATVAAATSGAFLAMLTAAAGFLFWPIRARMRLVRWGIVLAILALAVVMKAPVWYLFAKISDLTGGTGWHRSYLIDQAIAHFNEWWLVGSTYTAHWAPSGQVIEADADMMDITNQYIWEGLGGGIWKLGLMVAMIVAAFKIIGRWTKTTDLDAEPRTILVWALGVCLLGHCMSFMSVVYFDQIVVMWYWLLAGVSMLALTDPASEPVLEPQEDRESDPEGEILSAPDAAEPGYVPFD
jgi:hypothetical protein